MNKWTRATAVIIENDNVLLFRRVKKGHEYYSFPGGKVEEGESVEEALVREVEEEVSLAAASFRLLDTVRDIPTTSRTGIMDSMVFLVERWSGAPELGGPEKERHCDGNQYHVEWVPLSELEQMENIFPVGVKAIVLAAAKNI